MKWIFVSLVTATVAMSLAERPERNSFINYPIHSVQDLVREIQKDPAVADRYERNFAMTEEQVVNYVSRLHLDRLHESGVYDVYSVPPDGHIKWHQQRLRQGVAILADANGLPVMLLKCGNPLVMRVPRPVGIAPAGPSAPIMDIPPLGAETPQVAMAMAPPPATPEDIYVPPAAAPIAPAEAAFAGVGTGSANYGWLGFLAAGGLIYGLTTIHGHQNHPPAPVPEPTSFAIVGLGLTGALLRKKKNPGA
jgi:hypothetical protein